MSYDDHLVTITHLTSEWNALSERHEAARWQVRYLNPGEAVPDEVSKAADPQRYGAAEWADRNEKLRVATEALEDRVAELEAELEPLSPGEQGRVLHGRLVAYVLDRFRRLEEQHQGTRLHGAVPQMTALARDSNLAPSGRSVQQMTALPADGAGRHRVVW
jgi:hypothetical protein